LNVQVAGAPVSYGVFELTVGGDRDLPSAERVASEIAAAGCVGSELGPPGFFGRGRAVAETLAGHGLVLVGSFLPMRLSDDGAFAADLDDLRATLADLTEAEHPGAPPLILLSDAFCEPARMFYAGRIEEHREAWLSTAGWGRLVHNAHRAAEICREAGFPVSFHHHAGTYVETRREIDRLVSQLDTALMGLCFDSGHAAFGGAEPLALLAEYGELVNHVHIKDVDLELLAALHQRGDGLEVAWAEGVFCRLGTGGAQVEACLERLRAVDYEGWIVVEQDTMLSARFPLSRCIEDAQANVAYVRERLPTTA
jgi:inosose dehydratase